MSMKLTRALINSLCFAVVVFAVISRSETVAVAGAVFCLLAAAVVYLRRIPELSSVSQDSPKVRTFRFVTVFTVGYVLLVLGFAVAAKNGVFDKYLEDLSEERMDTVFKLLMAALAAAPVVFYGNVSQKLPLDRYTGFRLPWTVRDEGAWLIANRLLGYLSVPVALALFIAVPTPMSLDRYMKLWWLGCLLVWMLIPAALSGIYFWRKYRKKR